MHYAISNGIHIAHLGSVNCVEDDTDCAGEGIGSIDGVFLWFASILRNRELCAGRADAA
jgi:hypothetical protein